MISMKNDIRLKEYPKTDHYDYFDQYAAKKLFKRKWDSTIFRFLFNVSLPFIFSCSLFYFPIKYIWRFLKRKEIDVRDIRRIFLCNDSHLYHISKRADLQTEKDYWFNTFSNPYNIPHDCKIICAEDLISLKEILQCSWQAFLIHLQTIFNLGYDKYFLSYNAYEWCICDFALRHLPMETELLYSSIYDRMAIMFDSLPHNKKIMIQHGSMFMRHKIVKDSPYYEWLSDMNFYVVSGYYKSSPSKIYCLSENDKIALSRSVIANNPEYVTIGYDFVPNLLPNRKSVLIVGFYNLYYNNESYIVNELKGLDIDVYIKNHPTVDDSLYDELRNSATDLEFIKGGSSVYPKVDVVISYESTLAYEYISIGTKVLFYDDVNLSEIREIVVDILSQ